MWVVQLVSCYTANIQDIAKVRRAKRLEEGAMMSTKLKISFRLDDNGQPIDCDTYSRTDANSLVEEVGTESYLTNTSSCYWPILLSPNKSHSACQNKLFFADTKVPSNEE